MFLSLCSMGQFSLSVIVVCESVYKTKCLSEISKQKNVSIFYHAQKIFMVTAKTTHWESAGCILLNNCLEMLPHKSLCYNNLTHNIQQIDFNQLLHDDKSHFSQGQKPRGMCNTNYGNVNNMINMKNNLHFSACLYFCNLLSEQHHANLL